MYRREEKVRSVLVGSEMGRDFKDDDSVLRKLRTI